MSDIPIISVPPASHQESLYEYTKSRQGDIGDPSKDTYRPTYPTLSDYKYGSTIRNTYNQPAPNATTETQALRAEVSRLTTELVQSKGIITKLKTALVAASDYEKQVNNKLAIYESDVNELRQYVEQERALIEEKLGNLLHSSMGGQELAQFNDSHAMKPIFNSPLLTGLQDTVDTFIGNVGNSVSSLCSLLSMKVKTIGDNTLKLEQDKELVNEQLKQLKAYEDILVEKFDKVRLIEARLFECAGLVGCHIPEQPRKMGMDELLRCLDVLKANLAQRKEAEAKCSRECQTNEPDECRANSYSSRIDSVLFSAKNKALSSIVGSRLGGSDYKGVARKYDNISVVEYLRKRLKEAESSRDDLQLKLLSDSHLNVETFSPMATQTHVAQDRNIGPATQILNEIGESWFQST